MEAVSDRPSRDLLISQIGEETLACLLASDDNVDHVAQMFAILENGSAAFVSAVQQALTSEAPLVRALKSVPIDEIAECLDSARACSPAISGSLLDAIGGTDHILKLLRDGNPWITELDIRPDEDKTIAFARILYVSEVVQGDAREACVELGQMLCRCLPIDSVDIQALTPGGHEMRIDYYTHGVSKLKCEYSYAGFRIAWNQARIREACALFGDTYTHRLTHAKPLLRDLADLVLERATIFLIGPADDLDREEFGKRVHELHDAGRDLRPPIQSDGSNGTETAGKANAFITDHLSSLIIDLTGNVLRRLSDPDQYRPVAAFISDTVLTHLEGAINEPWEKLGLTKYPPSLDRLRDTLNDLYAVVYQISRSDVDASKIVQSAKSGKREEALQRAAKTSRRLKRLHIHKRRRAIQKLCSETTRLTTSVLPRQKDRPILLDFAITIELDTLFDWLDVASELAEALIPQRPVDEAYLLIPQRRGRLIPRLVFQVNRHLIPSPGLPEWTMALPDPWPSQLADRFSDAEAALEILSGISHLPEDHLEHHLVETAAKEANEQLLSAHENLLALPTDPLVATLVELVEGIAGQVQEELDGTHTGKGFMEQLASSVYQNNPTDEFNLILFFTYLALEWHIDKEGAIARLLSDR